MTKEKDGVLLSYLKSIEKKVDIQGEHLNNIDTKVDKFGGRLDIIEKHNLESRKNVYDRLGSLESFMAVVSKELYGNGKKGMCQKVDELNKVLFIYMGAFSIVIYLIQFLLPKYLK